MQNGEAVDAAAANSAEKTPEKTPEKAPLATPEKAPPSTTEKAPEKSPVKASDKTPGKTPEKTAEKAPEEVTKRTFRIKVWKHLEGNGLAVFPRPVFQRIPNYKGAGDATDRLVELDVFKNATNIRVNPDKPQESVRIKCLEHKKTLYVPSTRQQETYLYRIDLPEDVEPRKAVSRKGMEDYGKPIGIDEKVSLDIVVMGSVAVSREGYRIGNGRGYSDLEFGVMAHLKAVQPSTVVITVVHDSQVFDTLPAHLFGPHDVPVDIIVTPTQVIETQRMCQRPTGLLWHLLSNRRLEQMPLLTKLREIEIQNGNPCPLKEVDTDVEDRSQLRARRIRRRTRSYHRAHSDKEEGNTTEGEQSEAKPRRNSMRRRNSQKSNKDGENTPVKRKSRKPRPAIEFSVKLSNITPNTRVRDLKAALSERGVKPQIMIWKGFRGFCYLHFLKPNASKLQKGDQKESDSPPPVLNMESVLSALKELSITEGVGEGEEPVKPYSVLVEAAPPRQPKLLDAAPEVVPTQEVTAV